MKNYESVIIYKFDEKKSSASEESTFLYDKESYFANVGLWVLTGGIYGLVSYIIKLVRVFKLKKYGLEFSVGFVILYIIATHIPFVSFFANVKLEKILVKYINKHDPGFKGKNALVAVTSVFLPLFLNVVDMVEKDRLFNKILEINTSK